MRTRLTRKPGEKGAKELTAMYGDRLVCVRYRYDSEKKRRFKTVEIIVEETEWIAKKEVVMVKVAWGEKKIAYEIKKEGGVWSKSKQAWELSYEKVEKLGLQERIIKEWEKRR